MKTLTDPELLQTLLPSSISGEPIFRNAVTALAADDDTKGHLEDGLFYARLEELSGETLDHLAAQWQPLVWRDSWSLETKRIMLRVLIEQRSRLGTRAAIRHVMAPVTAGMRIVEWWEETPPGREHTFKVTVNQSAVGHMLPAEQTEDCIRLLNLAKPVRSQYTFTLEQHLHIRQRMALRGQALTYLRPLPRRVPVLHALLPTPFIYRLQPLIFFRPRCGLVSEE